MGKYDYDERMEDIREIERLKKERSLLLCFLENKEYPNLPGADIKTTYDYLQKIAIMEDLHGDIGWEKDREILLKYFNGYKFESEEAAKRLMYAFMGKQPVLAWKYMKMYRIVDDFNGYYRFNAQIDDNIKMTIKDEIVIEVKPFEDYFK